MFKKSWRNFVDLIGQSQLEFIKNHPILYGVLLLVFGGMVIIGMIGQYQAGKMAQEIEDETTALLERHMFVFGVEKDYEG